jgi:hypothetical protein
VFRTTLFSACAPAAMIGAGAHFSCLAEKRLRGGLRNPGL